MESIEVVRAITACKLENYTTPWMAFPAADVVYAVRNNDPSIFWRVVLGNLFETANALHFSEERHGHSLR